MTEIKVILHPNVVNVHPKTEVQKIVVSPVGIQGIKGDKGDDGQQGIQGVAGQDGLDGNDGLSAYQIAVNNGFVGTESAWLLSLKGDQGEQGIQGEKGDKGDTGATGQGIATGGATGQFLTKNSGTNYDTSWATITKSTVGLANVDNTSDADKPISTATQTALNAKATLSDITTAINALKGGVSVDGDTLDKLNDKIIAIQTLLASDNINLDTVQEIVDAIETVQTSLSTILVNDLTTGGATKALTAEQGVTLKGLIDSLTTVISGKANTSHTHSISDITNLQSALDGKQVAGSYANATHTHGIMDITGLQLALDAKQPLTTVLTNTTASFTTADKTKLDGIESGATANSSDATLLNRANHTGTQAISTVTNLQTSLDAKAETSRFEGFNKITVGTTAPSSPSIGDLWIDTN